MFNRLANLSNRAVMLIMIGIAGVASVLSAVVSAAYNVDTSPGWWVSWLQNFSTEMFGAFLTFVFIELIVGQREKRWEEERSQKELKTRLIRDLQNKIDVTAALRAAEEMRAYGWLNPESLKGSYALRGVNLPGVHLNYANLQGLSLEAANLEGAKLRDANLKRAYMESINLRGSDLSYADLQGADLESAELQRATLQHAILCRASLVAANLENANLLGADLGGAQIMFADLEGANLYNANLQQADLTGAKLSESSRLPDYSMWTPKADLTRFTNPSHPDFWHWDDPAFRFKEEN